MISESGAVQKRCCRIGDTALHSPEADVAGSDPLAQLGKLA
jgi:hypothetical protein